MCIVFVSECLRQDVNVCFSYFTLFYVICFYATLSCFILPYFNIFYFIFCLVLHCFVSLRVFAFHALFRGMFDFYSLTMLADVCKPIPVCGQLMICSQFTLSSL